MSEPSSSGGFRSLEDLRKHWSKKASNRGKSEHGESFDEMRTRQPEGRGADPADVNGHAGGARDFSKKDVRIPDGAAPKAFSGGRNLRQRFARLGMTRSDMDIDSGQGSATETSLDATDGLEDSSSDSDGQTAHNPGANGKPAGIAAVTSRQPPSLSVMRPLGDSGSFVDRSAPEAAAPIPESTSGPPPRAVRGNKGVKPPSSAGAAAAAGWMQSQSVQQLSTGVAQLGKQVVKAVGRAEKEQAILKLYAVLCQTAWVAQPGMNEDWTASYLGLLELGLPRFVKHAAALVLRTDKGYSSLVRGMAAAILKTLTRWMEGQINNTDRPETRAVVRGALDAVLLDGSAAGRQAGGLADTQNDYMTTGGGYGNLLDTDALEGLLDPEIAPSGRHSSRRGGGSITDTHHMFGSLMDTGSLEALVHQNTGRPVGRSNPLLGTQMLSSFGSALDTSDIAGHMMEHKGALRATIWLFKSDQPDAWYAAASLVGSIAQLGTAHIDAMGGVKLVKPLMWVLRNGDSLPKYAAMRALSILSHDTACRTVMARQDKYLRAMVRVLQGADDPAKYLSVSTLNMLLAHDPSTHWVLAQSGVVAGLVGVLKQPLGPPEVKADATLGLKHLTSSSQRNRDGLLAAKGLKHVIALVLRGNADAQYNAARILRHLAMGSTSGGKAAAREAIPALVHTLKVGRPRVCFACAAALAMVTEGQPAACAAIEAEDGIRALVQLLIKGGGQGKKVAAEALQALAAESEDMRPKIAEAGALKPLVQMIQIGNLQQQAAAAGAVQALAYCPSARADLAGALVDHGAVAPLVQVLKTAPRPMRCAAAGALCNLTLKSDTIQTAVVEEGAIEPLVDLLSEAQPDGQYSAAAALLNLAGAGSDVRRQIVDSKALGPLVNMLTADSWYCRIVAADLIACLGSDGPVERKALVDAATLRALVSLLCLQHSRGTLEEVGGPVAHLAYERSQDVIVMKGYKFARAKLAAAATIGSVALLDEGVATFVSQEGPVAEEMTQMLACNNSQVRGVAAAALADLAVSSLEARNAILQSDAPSQLVTLLKAGVQKSQPKKGPRTGPQEGYHSDLPQLADAAAAARALTELARSDVAAAKLAVAQGALPVLVALLDQGSEAEAMEALGLLSCLSTASPAAEKAVKEAGLQGRVANFSQEQRAWGKRGATAAWLQRRMEQQTTGYAITAKPSANLYILLQVPFEALMPAGRYAADLGLRKNRSPGRRRDRAQSAEMRKRSMQQFKAGGESAKSARGKREDSVLESVTEGAPLARKGPPPPETGGYERGLSDEEHWSAEPQLQSSDQYSQLGNPPAGKSRSDILETWTDV